ncbi:FecR family protein [Desulfovulcanus sp.]
MRSVLFLFVFLFVSYANCFSYELPLSGQALVNLVEGNVLLCVKEASQKLKQGDKIMAPARVEVKEKSRIELVMPDGSILRFAAGTEFELVKAVAEEGKRDIQVDVALGDCWASVRKLLGEDSNFQVNSPTAVAGVAGTKYRLSVSADKHSLYLVYGGKIKVGYRPDSPKSDGGSFGVPQRVQGPHRVAGPKRVSMQEWMFIVQKGYQFNIRPDGAFERPKPFDMVKDSQNPWVKWNLMRDKEFGL